MSELDVERLAEALRRLPPGPYRVDGPHEQGGLARLYGRQGTRPDFTDGWAIPLVAAGVPEVIVALGDLLNELAAVPRAGADSAAKDPSDPRGRGAVPGGAGMSEGLPMPSWSRHVSGTDTILCECGHAHVVSLGDDGGDGGCERLGEGCSCWEWHGPWADSAAPAETTEDPE